MQDRNQRKDSLRSKNKPFITEFASQKSQGRYPNCAQLELTTSMKQIVCDIREKSLKRIKRYKEEVNQYQMYNEQVEDMISSLKLKKHSNLNHKLGIYQINHLILMKEMQIEIIVKNNQSKKECVLSLLQNLEKEVERKTLANRFLKDLAQQNKNYSLSLKYFKSLKSNLQQSQEHLMKLREKANKSQEQLQHIKRKIKQLSQEFQKTDGYLDKMHELNKCLEKQQAQFSQKCLNVSKQKVPNQEEMINCMFLVGVLKQQIFVLFLQRKQNSGEKNLAQADKANRFMKIYQNFAKRSILINILNSEIVYFSILTGIYMHCKSLVSNNLVSAMNTLSFFSDDFKVIYLYKAFQKYMIIMIEKLKFNKQWEKMKLNIQLSTRQLNSCKKDLILKVKQEHFSYLQNVLSIFQIDNQFYINMGNLKMKIKLKKIIKNDDQYKNDFQNENKRNFFLPHTQDNELYLDFDA